MAVNTQLVSLFLDTADPGQYLRNSKLNVSNLASGNNQVPHGLLNVLSGAGVTPLQVSIEPASLTVGGVAGSGNATFYEYQPADATNIYITAAGVGAQNAPFSCSIYLTY